MLTYQEYLEAGKQAKNKVGFLMTLFTELHPNAPQSDFKVLNGRAAGLMRLTKSNIEPIIQMIWCSCAKDITGSHLDYITISVKTRMKANGMNQPKLEGHAGMETD